MTTTTTNENDIIPPEKRAELNRTETGRQAVRVIDTLTATVHKQQQALKECAELAESIRKDLVSPPLYDRLQALLGKFVSPFL